MKCPQVCYLSNFMSCDQNLRETKTPHHVSAPAPRSPGHRASMTSTAARPRNPRTEGICCLALGLSGPTA
ncbi:hypothetical protein J4Q44_G00387690 [Coregonus suidteri]|uniref:Uncharacterized protein n=1 Tax=Coregonus suidteri TaxID=861788 RepID=A0AAN8KQQ8_9TELE